jgi:hypothetical protein
VTKNLDSHTHQLKNKGESIINPLSSTKASFIRVFFVSASLSESTIPMATLEYSLQSANGIEHGMFHSLSSFKFGEAPSSRTMRTSTNSDENSQSRSSIYGPITIGLDASVLEDTPHGTLPFPPNLKPQLSDLDLSLSNQNQLAQHTGYSKEHQMPGLRDRIPTSHLMRGTKYLDSTVMAGTTGVKAPLPTPTTTSPSSQGSSYAVEGLPKAKNRSRDQKKSMNLSMNNRIQQILQEKGIETIKLPYNPLADITSRSTRSSFLGAGETKDTQLKIPENEADQSSGSFSDLASQHQKTHSQKKWDPEIWVRPRYLSGPIRTEPTFGLYTIPVMTAMDVLCHTGVAVDDQVIDNDVSFFESFGFQPITSDLDKYWTTTADLVPQTSKQNSAQSTPMISPHRHSKTGLASSMVLDFSKTASQFSDSSSSHSQPLGSPALTNSSSLGGSAGVVGGASSSGGNRRISAAFSFFRGTTSAAVSLRSGEAGMIESSSRGGSLESVVEGGGGNSGGGSSSSLDQRPTVNGNNIPCKMPPAASHGRATSQESSDWSPHASSSHRPLLFNNWRLPKRSSASTFDQLQQKPQVPRAQGQNGNKLSFKKLLDLGGSSAYDAYGYSQSQ